MRLPTAKILTVIIAVLASLQARAQLVVSNPLEWLALAEGNEAINGQVKDQTDAQTRTAALQNTIAAEFTKIHEWEKKYSGYLQTASGFASSLKASATLYEDGVRIFITLGKLKKAIGSNPQGIVATMSMNNLYLETATELISVYTLLREAIATGGRTNMLTDALGIVRQTRCILQETQQAVPEHTVLHAHGRVEQHHGGNVGQGHRHHRR